MGGAQVVVASAATRAGGGLTLVDCRAQDYEDGGACSNFMPGPFFGSGPHAVFAWPLLLRRRFFSLLFSLKKILSLVGLAEPLHRLWVFASIIVSY